MRALRNISVLIVLLMAAGKSYAQVGKFDKALELYQAKKLDSARICIDSAALHPQTRNDYRTWMVRGFIYKDLYRSKESTNTGSTLRDEAIESLKRSLKLDSTNQNPQKDIVIKGFKFVAASYHNDINKTLDTLHYEVSLTNASKFVAATKFIDASFNEKAYNFEVFLTVGSMFEKEYEHSPGKNNLDLAKVYLFKAHDLDSSSFLVNKNLGLLYYNQAVEIINKMDADISLEELPIYQDRSVKLGKQALSYCLKAHTLKPEDKVVVEALAGIYYLLNETEKHNEYKKKLEALNRQ